MSKVIDILQDEYFDWLYSKVCGDEKSPGFEYRKLLMQLHSIEFAYLMEKDGDRAEDGVNLRYRFAITHNHDPEFVFNVIWGPCTVLEMMVALAIRCEETIMDDAHIGDRTRQWFWEMAHSLGIDTMRDSKFDKDFVDRKIDKFLRREYSPDGRGGLFTLKHCDQDLRDVEIWYQLCWHLNEID